MHVIPFLTVSPTFTTLSFWSLFGCTYFVYLLFRRNLILRNLFLLIISYVFVVLWDWQIPVVLIICTVSSYCIGLTLDCLSSKKSKEIVLTVAVAFYICVLLYFKYCSFFIDNLNVFLRAIGISSIFTGLHIILPLGISFFVFQIISYLIDIYRGVQKPVKDFLSYALHLVFFAKFIAGPIERVSYFVPQLQSLQKISRDHILLGIFLIVWGLVQKIVIANNVAIYASYSLLTPQSIGSNSFTILLALPLQIYADFSGYSDIARGIASLLSFSLSRNFNIPYLALSPSDFWRRWHISLSQWCRDYIYIPLGGNRRGFLFTLRNLFFTMLVVGLWHGATWNYIEWGVYNGILAIIYILVEKYVPSHRLYAKFFHHKIVAGCVWFFLVSIGWIMFQTYSSEPFWSILLSMRFSFGRFFPYLLMFWVPIILMHYLDFRAQKNDSIASKNFIIYSLFILICMYSLIFLSPIRHFEFIYKQF